MAECLRDQLKAHPLGCERAPEGVAEVMESKTPVDLGNLLGELEVAANGNPGHRMPLAGHENELAHDVTTPAGKKRLAACVRDRDHGFFFRLLHRHAEK